MDNFHAEKWVGHNHSDIAELHESAGEISDNQIDQQ
jgi:hypothetical protein